MICGKISYFLKKTFISKKKDVKLLSNMGIYDKSLVKLLLKEPISNIIYCKIG